MFPSFKNNVILFVNVVLIVLFHGRQTPIGVDAFLLPRKTTTTTTAAFRTTYNTQLLLQKSGSTSSSSLPQRRRNQQHHHTTKESSRIKKDTKIEASATTEAASSTTSYDAGQITVLEGLEPVRKRPGMYIGSTGPDGLHHLIWEVVDNSVDEALSGYATFCALTIHDDDDDDDNNEDDDDDTGNTRNRRRRSINNSITVVDDGRGIPTDKHPVTQTSALETVLTVLHAGGKFNNQANANNSNDGKGGGGYKVSGGLHGVGISVVNALSEYVDVRVDRNELSNSMLFKRGKAQETLQTIPINQATSITDALEVNFDNEYASLQQKMDKIQSKNNNSSKKKKKKKDDDDDEDLKSLQNIEQQKENLELFQKLINARTTGTAVRFRPDIEVFKGDNGEPDITFETSRLVNRMDEIAYLNAGLVLAMTDARRSSKTTTKKGDGDDIAKSRTTIFYHAGGLAEYVDYLCRTKTPLLSNENSKKTAKKKTSAASKKRKDNEDEMLSSLLTSDGKTLLCSGTYQPQIKTDKRSKASSTAATAPPPPVTVSIALRWSSDMYSETILSFCNNIRTRDGGSHVDGLKASLTRTVNQMVKQLLNKKTSGGGKASTTDSIPGEYIREGLTAIISVSVIEPEFEGQTKGRLGNPEVRPAVDQLLSSELTKLFEYRPDILNAIYTKASAAQSAAQAAKAARDLVRRKTLLTSSVLPGKLADCSTRNPIDGEIFIVEGDSAAGSAKQGRDRKTQAILPLRGKILNIERAPTQRIYQNTELQGLISALGLGVKGSLTTSENGDDDGGPVDLMKTLRYGKIIIMTDADVDGAHIRVLLLTFFYRYQRELIEHGHIYIAQPPLYKVTMKGGGGKKKQEVYAYSDAEKDRVLLRLVKNNNNDSSDDREAVNAALASGKATIQRFKGLGEMMAEQLWSTTMDPERRKLLQVTAEDAAVADQTLSILMGDAAAPRRNFINTRADRFQLEDLDL